YLRGEIDMPRRVDDVNALLNPFENFVNAFFLALRPGAGGRGRRNRDATLTLLFHPVGDGGALVHLAHLVNHAGIKQHALGDRGLAGVDMRCDPDVPRSFQRELAIARGWIFRQSFFLFHRRRRHNLYHLKCANARFACAILCVSSRFLIALPWPAAASLISCANASSIGTPLRWSAYVTIQRVASEICRAGATSIGT